MDAKWIEDARRLAQMVDDGMPTPPRGLGALFLCDSCGQYASHREVARNRGSASCPDQRSCGGTLFQVPDTPAQRLKSLARSLLGRVPA